jgi:hypothetical protein
VFGAAAGSFPATVDLSSLDGDDGFRLEGIAPDDQTGASVNAAGDVNGDGFADVIVGAPLADAGGSDAGAAYVVFGGDDGFPESFDLADLNGTNGFAVLGADAGDRAGASVAGAGDINGDGFDDLVLNSGRDGEAEYSAFVLFGKAGGFDATVDLRSLAAGEALEIIRGPSEGGAGGVQSVSAAGDVNDDGFGDLIVGSFDAAYVIFGGEDIAGSAFI